jgi:hypothetical protein
MGPYDTDALVSKLGHNSRTEKVGRSKFELGLPFMVLYLVYTNVCVCVCACVRTCVRACVRASKIVITLHKTHVL